jgi:hypothetical protein
MVATKRKKSFLRLLAAFLLFLWPLLLSTGPAVQAAVSIPSVAGPIPVSADSYPFNAANHSTAPQDLSKYGYIEEEYFLSGRTNVYTLDASNKAVVKTSDAPYTNRILVRRPTSLQGFSGTVVVEILNPTRMFDVDYQWQFLRDFLLDHKIAWVGVTSKPIAVKALKAFDSKRYATLSWANPLSLEKTCAKPASLLWDTEPATENGLVWDIVSQVGALVRSKGSQNPLKGLPVDKVYLVGYSQSGGYVVTYVTFIRPLTSALLENGEPIYDGYFNGDGDGLYGLAPALDQCSLPPLSGDPRFILGPNPEPVMTVVSQTRIGMSLADRRPDSDAPADRYRRYEVPGASHLSRMQEGLSPTAADMAKAGRPPRTPACTEIMANGVSDFPFEYFMTVAFANLDAWARSGTVPPRTPLMDVAEVADSPLPVPKVDKYGNAIGGYRSPYVDVPIATYFGQATPENPAARLSCNLSGYKVPLKKEELQGLYSTHGDYVKKVAEEVDAMVNERLIMPADGQRIKDEAVRMNVP